MSTKITFLRLFVPRPRLALASALLFLSTAQAGEWAAPVATVVLGQADMTTNATGLTASDFKGPMNACTDPTTGKVFVLAYEQHRILRFSAAAATQTHSAAEAVIGQPDMTSATANNGGISAKTLKAPTSCAFDASGHLYVTDSGNHRVLRYDNPSTAPDFPDASAVLGQADFASTEGATSASRFDSGTLIGLATGPHGELYVSDSSRGRVLRWKNAATQSNGADADGVFGAPNFTTANWSNSGGLMANSFSISAGLAVDSYGSLYVSDLFAMRILRFDDAVNLPNGASANGVLGAPDVNSLGYGACQSNCPPPPAGADFGLLVPNISYLGDDGLYVSDSMKVRILVFMNARQKADGAAADYVIGWPDLYTPPTGPNPSATQLGLPGGVSQNAFNGYLMVSDYGNNRVLGFYNEALLNKAPSASQLGISTNPTVGQPATGSYTYHDLDIPSDLEGNSSFRWLIDSQAGGTNKQPILNATTSTYTPIAQDIGKYLFFCVTPKATTGNSPGVETCSAGVGPVLAPANAAPTASNLAISGTAQVGSQLTGSYTYADGDTPPDVQNTSGTGTSYRFVRADSALMTTNPVNVGNGATGGSNKTYTPVAGDVGKYLFYCVTPIALTGTLTGTEVCSSATAAVSLIPQAITSFTPTTPVVFGASPATLTASGGASGNPIVFGTTSASSICTVSASTVTFVGVGVCNLTANQAAGGNYSAAPQATASITINAAAQAITGFAPTTPVLLGASPAALTASGGASGNPIVFATTSASSICTVSGSTVTFVGIGVCNLTANQAAGGNYSAAPRATASITIYTTYTIGGTASGLGTGKSAVLQNNAGNDLTVSSNAGFTFTIAVNSGSTYAVTVKTQPTGQTCVVGSGTGTANANVTNVSVSCLDNTTTGSTPGGQVTAAITGGSCAGYQSGSTLFSAPVNPPAGQTFPYGVFGFTAVSCGTGGTVTITLTYPNNLPSGTKYWKSINGTWVDWTSHVTISGKTVVLTLTDGAYGDTNPNPGEISDPGGPAYDPIAISAGIPTLSEWGLILLASLLAMFGLVQVRRRQGF